MIVKKNKIEKIGQFIRNEVIKFQAVLIGSFLFSIVIIPTINAENLKGIEAFNNLDMDTAKLEFSQSLEKNNRDALALHYLAKVAMNEDKLDDAEEFIEQVQSLTPNNSVIQYDAAIIFAAQAQDASIFSAPGYAAKSLKAFKQAAELEPGTLKYRQGLMNFYLHAPGIVGGDDELAEAEAVDIAKIDLKKGTVALANVYQNTDQDDKLKALYESVDKSFSDYAAIYMNRGMYYQSQEKFDLAVADFRKIQTLKPESEEDHTIFSALYQIGRSSVLSSTNNEEGITALNLFIDKAPIHDSLPSKPWAKYRLGTLYRRIGEEEKARRLYLEATDETTEKRLVKLLKKELRKRPS